MSKLSRARRSRAVYRNYRVRLDRAQSCGQAPPETATHRDAR